MKKAFTLAEVLITLAIIGVVAAMTIPTLIQKHQEKVLVTRFKHSTSLLEQAFLFAINENGPVESWNTDTAKEGIYYPNAAVETFDKIKPFLKISKECELANGIQECFGDGKIITILGKEDTGGNSTAQYKKFFVLANGVGIGLDIRSLDCTSILDQANNVCGVMQVKLSKDNPVLMHGKDILQLLITPKGILPMGIGTDMSKMCSTTGTSGGWMCSAWVLQYENMDYLHCDGLSWNGKTTCR